MAIMKAVDPTAPAGLADGLTALEDRVRRGELLEARRLAEQMEQQWPDDEQVRRFARLLAPPVVSVRQEAPPRPRHQEYRWLRDHAAEHPGCWLAVLGDRLIWADADVRVVMEAVREDPAARGALLYFQPEG
jgi:hypothetical protein